MSILGKREPVVLFVGDILMFFVSLILMLGVRYRYEISSIDFFTHLYAFSIIFIASVAVFFIAGLYERHTLIFRSRLPSIILRAQITNCLIAVLFFYFVAYFKITPKVNLFIYLAISFGLTLLWRIYGYSYLFPKRKQNAVLIGSGEELRELEHEVNHNDLYGIKFVSTVDINALESLDFKEEVIMPVYKNEVTIIAVDMKNEKIEPILPHLYNLIFSKVRFVDMHKVYEDIFNRVPLSLVRYNWFLENISTSPQAMYDFLKRLMDIVIATILGIVSLVAYPFVWLAIKLDDGGPVFAVFERVGVNNRHIKLLKFRTMDRIDQGEWDKGIPNKVTKVGHFLRKTRLDELPQLWNVIWGDLSLIGPRPEFPGPVKIYENQVPYYNVRHLIKPGLSGWAQIYHENHPHHEADVLETRIKLSYDLYYIKNRSFMLDLKIALKTIKILLSRSGL